MQSARKNRTEEGLTLMESLVGIMVIAIVITAITPPMLIAFATRVQNYRVQNAMQIAQGEINRVRLLVEAGNIPNWTQQIPPTLQQAGAFWGKPVELDYVPAPASNPNPPNCPLPNPGIGSSEITRWCGVDINGDNNWDLGVQTFRSSIPPLTNDLAKKPIAFLMGVRVYTRAALTSGQLKNPPRGETASIGLTSGQAVSLPIVTRYETIVRGDLDISKFAYCELNNELAGYSGCNMK